MRTNCYHGKSWDRVHVEASKLYYVYATDDGAGTTPVRVVSTLSAMRAQRLVQSSNMQGM